MLLPKDFDTQLKKKVGGSEFWDLEFKDYKYFWIYVI